MTITNWNTTFIDGKPFLVIDVAKFRIPLDWDPSSNMFIAVAAPDGGLGNFPALVRGDDGAAANIDTSILYTPLDFEDPTPEFASFSEIAPQVWQLSLGLRRGAPGTDGVMVLNPLEYGTPVARRILQLKDDLSGFEYVAQKCGNRYLPATILNVPTGNPSYTMCAIGIEAQPFDYYPEIEGQTVFTGTGSDVRVNLYARLSTTGIINGETAGPLVGQGFGPIGVNAAGIATVFSSCPPAGSVDVYGKVLAGNSATVFVRGERQAGGNTFSTDSSTSCYKVRVAPIP